MLFIVLVLLENSAFHLRRFSLWKYPKIKIQEQELSSWVTLPEQSGPKSGDGLLCPFPWGDLGPHLTQYHLSQGLPHTKWHLDPSNRLAIAVDTVWV